MKRSTFPSRVRAVPALVGPLALAVSLLAPSRATAAPAPLPGTLETGWATEAYVDPGYSSQSATIVFDANDVATCIFAGSTSDQVPLRILWSQVSGLSTWSPAQPAFPPTTAWDILPQTSRAPDGTVWVAWLRGSTVGGGTYSNLALLAARFVGGTWSLPETVAVGLPILDGQAPTLDFSILGVSADSAWVTWAEPPDGDPFSTVRDLLYSVRSAGGWSPAGTLSNLGLSESHPVLVRTTTGAPAALFTFSNAIGALNGARWDGSAWVAGPSDQFVATGIYGFDAAPDTSGAVRVMAFVRETDVNGLEDHVRELVWNESGFHEGPSVSAFPVVLGAEGEPPSWSGISLAVGRACPACASPLADREFRASWLDFTDTGDAHVFTVLRTQDRFEPIEQAGLSFELTQGWPRSAQDLSIDRWYETWNAPPAAQGLRRAKFSYSQTFAGDLDLGANYIAPDTVRVTIVCTGDATGRTFHLYRVKADATQQDPPLPPPVPANAVALPGNPYAGRCPFDVDDFPGPGRWFYYAVLDAQGAFPERDARALQPVVVPDTTGGGGNGVPARTALLGPRPQPALGPMSLPYDLASAGDVSVLIRDLRGRLVRVLVLGPRTAGSYRDYNAPVWDGEDGSGHTARAGVYFATLAVNGRATGPGQRIVYLP